jgi:hypothetical protein
VFPDAQFTGSRRLTLGADKAYDVREFVDDLRDRNVSGLLPSAYALDVVKVANWSTSAAYQSYSSSSSTTDGLRVDLSHGG